MGKKNNNMSAVLAVALAVTLAGITGCSQSNPNSVVTIPTVDTTPTAATTPTPLATLPPAPTTAPTTPPPDPTAPPATEVPDGGNGGSGGGTGGGDPTPPPATPAPTEAPPATATPDGGNGGSGGGTGGGDATATPAPPQEMTIEAITAVIDPNAESESIEAMAWGDVDGDGDEDAVVRTTWCGASCGTQLDLVLNDNSTPTLYGETGVETFRPWYLGTSAAQSSLQSATIATGQVTLVGTGLCGDVAVGETDEPGVCNYETVRTALYSFADGVLSPVSIDPVPGA